MPVCNCYIIEEQSDKEPFKFISIADEIVVIANGQIRAFGPREEILPTLLSDEKTGRCPINAKGVEY